MTKKLLDISLLGNDNTPLLGPSDLEAEEANVGLLRSPSQIRSLPFTALGGYKAYGLLLIVLLLICARIKAFLMSIDARCHRRAAQ